MMIHAAATTTTATVVVATYENRSGELVAVCLLCVTAYAHSQQTICQTCVVDVVVFVVGAPEDSMCLCVVCFFAA